MRLYLPKHLEPRRAELQGIIEDGARGIASLDGVVVIVRSTTKTARSGHSSTGLAQAKSPAGNWVKADARVVLSGPIGVAGPLPGGKWQDWIRPFRGQPGCYVPVTWQQALAMLTAHEMGHVAISRRRSKRTSGAKRTQRHDENWCDLQALKVAVRLGVVCAEGAARRSVHLPAQPGGPCIPCISTAQQPGALNAEPLDDPPEDAPDVDTTGTDPDVQPEAAVSPRILPQHSVTPSTKMGDDFPRHWPDTPENRALWARLRH